MFGTTEDWSVWVMNIGSWLAAAWIGIAALRRGPSSRHPSPSPDAPSDSRRPADGWSRGKSWARVFFVLNLLLLAFCAVAVYNARASFSVEERSFTYFENYLPALPTTYDVGLTRQTLLNWSACFALFWALRYWLSQGIQDSARAKDEMSRLIGLRNPRFRTLLWILSLNGFLISIQAMLQRLGGSSNLLWFRVSYSGDPNSCFGPFSYRGNAAEYINLIWPATLGFWWILSRDRRHSSPSRRLSKDGPELLLIPAVFIMLTAAFMSLSRGGAIIAASMLLVALPVLVWQRKHSWKVWALAGAVPLIVAMLVFFVGVEGIMDRFKDPTLQNMSGRREIFAHARKIADDFPWFGAGPGAFRSVYHLYREDATQLWHAWVHDDWLETRVTMGRVGLTLIVLQLVSLGFWIFSTGRPAVHYVFSILATLGLVGCLVHAKFDFPMQTYSILYTFVALAAVLTSFSPASR